MSGGLRSGRRGRLRRSGRRRGGCWRRRLRLDAFKRHGRRLAAGAGFARIARGLGAHDGAFDEQIVWTAYHQKVFDIVAADDDELAVAVEIVGVHHAETRLTGSAGAAQAGAEQRSRQKHEQENDNQNRGKAEEPEQNRVAAGQITEELHISTRFRCALDHPQSLTYPPGGDGPNVNRWLMTPREGSQPMFSAFLG